jgi:hypothetical protein
MISWSKDASFILEELEFNFEASSDFALLRDLLCYY